MRIRLRPSAPPFWRNIAPELRERAFPELPETERVRYWRLVLDARNIPWRLYGKKRPSLYVPPVAALAATHEITAFEAEKPLPPMPRPPEKRGAYLLLVLLAFLALWHRLRWDMPLAVPDAPSGSRTWLALAGLDTYRVTAMHEWWRCVTALTLHADTAHLVSNVVTGGVFGIPLCRYTGVGLGFCLTVLAGAMGNALTALLRATPNISQGYSTAVFASVGLLASIAATLAFTHTKQAVRAVSPEAPAHGKALRQAAFDGLIPLGAGMGILAMFGGSDAPRVDYLAHVMGLVAGTILGLSVTLFCPHIFAQKGRAEVLLQSGALALALVLVGLAWGIATG